MLGQTLDDAAGEAFDKVARLLGLGAVRGQVQVGKEDLALAKHSELGRLRLLDLDHELGPTEDRGRVGDDLRTDGSIQGVVEVDRLSSAGLDDHLVPMRHELPNGARRQANTELVVLDLAGYADKHLDLSGRSAAQPQGPRPAAFARGVRAAAWAVTREHPRTVGACVRRLRPRLGSWPRRDRPTAALLGAVSAILPLAVDLAPQRLSRSGRRAIREVGREPDRRVDRVEDLLVAVQPPDAAVATLAHNLGRDLAGYVAQFRNGRIERSGG